MILWIKWVISRSYICYSFLEKGKDVGIWINSIQGHKVHQKTEPLTFRGKALFQERGTHGRHINWNRERKDAPQGSSHHREARVSGLLEQWEAR